MLNRAKATAHILKANPNAAHIKTIVSSCDSEDVYTVWVMNGDFLESHDVWAQPFQNAKAWLILSDMRFSKMIADSE
jgi:hypothetical protein